MPVRMNSMSNGRRLLVWQDAEEIRDPFWEVRWSALRPTLVRKLGAGSAGQVYEAYIMGAPVAVKILKNVDPAGQHRAVPSVLSLALFQSCVEQASTLRRCNQSSNVQHILPQLSRRAQSWTSRRCRSSSRRWTCSAS